MILKKLSFVLPMFLIISLHSCKENKQQPTKKTKIVNETPKELSEEEKKYKDIKTTHNLLGKWHIKNTFVKSLSYDYEIYHLDENYIGIKHFKELIFEDLNKKGNKYYVKGNKWGEYYKIEKDNKMTLFDNDGELTSAGLTAIKK